jgi:hypothetical protein
VHNLPKEADRICLKCEGTMTLQRIDHGLKGFENRVFQCERCFSGKTVVFVKLAGPAR